MFETESKQLVEKVVPSSKLVSDTLFKMQRLGHGRKIIHRVRGAVILVAVLLLGVIGVSAIALGGIKLVNWKGTDVTEEKLPDYETLIEASSREKLALQLCGQAPANEYWAINFYKDHWTYNKLKETITSLEDFESRIAISSNKFPIPRDIPEGYCFESAELVFYLSEKTIADGFTYLNKKVMDEGVTVYKYQAPDSIKENIAGYSIRFRKDEEQILNIQCDLGNVDGNQIFFLNEEEDSNGEPVTIKGMLDCLYLQKKSQSLHKLYLHAKYLPKEKIIPWPDGSYDKESSLMSYMIFNSLVFSINSNTLDKEQLIKVAQGLR